MWAEVQKFMRARVVSCLLLLFALAAPAFAADRQAEGRPSFDRILPEIRRHTPGTFYDAEGPFVGQDGQARYRIKWMTPEGRIVWFEVDAQRGRILGMVTGTLPVPSSRRDRGSEGYLPPYPADGDRGHDRYWRSEYRHGYVDRARIFFGLRQHHYSRFIGDPYWFDGRYVVRTYDRRGHVVIVEVDPYTGDFLGVIRF